jgi:replicative DNA helicase
MDVELNLLAKAIKDKEVTPLIEARVTTAYFDSDVLAQVYTWMLDFWNDFGAAPSEEAFYHNFDITLPDVNEPYAYYLKSFQDEYRLRLITEKGQELAKAVNESDIAASLFAISELYEVTNAEVSQTKDRDFVPEAIDWMDRYEELLNNDGKLLGIPSGFRNIDEVTSGFQPGQLITLFGLPGSMKSTLLLLFDIAAHKNNRKTLFETFEMTNTEQEMRHYCFRANVSYNRLRHGQLRPDEMKRLQQTLKTMKIYDDMIFVEDVSSTTTVQAIAAKIMQHKPDIVFVDGVYLMESENPEHIPGSPQALTHITRSLKRLAMRAKIPIVCTTQALASKYSKAAGIQLSSIGYSSSFAQDSDIVFGIERTDDEDIIQLKAIKARNNPKTSIYVSVDWENGVADEAVGPDGEDEEVSSYGFKEGDD